MLTRTRMQAVLITRGSRGMALFEPKRPTVHIPIFGSDEIADVTGAGDTVIATCALALAAGASFYEAARAGELRRRARRDEARHGDRQCARARPTPSGDHDTSLENWSQEGPAQGRKK